MKTNILATADALSDQDLLVKLDRVASNERGSTVEVIAHLAALARRPSLYAAAGYASLFAYCTQALRLSEDASCARIDVCHACRRFPVILDLLASGEMNLTSVRLLRKLLTPENHEAVLAKARGRTRRQIEALAAELAPQPDVPSSVRKLPTPEGPPPHAGAPTKAETTRTESHIESHSETRMQTSARGDTAGVALPAVPPARRPIVRATAPERYRVQFTIGQQTHEKLRRVQTLLRREIPDGDPGAIFDRALSLLLDKVEKTKLGKADRPRPRAVIRPETDSEVWKPERYVPRAVKRTVSPRDGDQCAFVSKDGRRCTEQAYLEFHHGQPCAKQGPATAENIFLRCRLHNQYEAELIFGPPRSP
jgi:hypothetical protein